MSTTAERYQKNVIDGINLAFGDLTIDCCRGSEKHPLLVRALERHVPGNGVSMGPSTGFSLTIGDRTANFSGEGRWIENVKAAVEYSEAEWRKVRDAKPGAYAKFCKGDITEAELFAEVAEAVKELVQPIAEKPQPAGAKK